MNEIEKYFGLVISQHIFIVVVTIMLPSVIGKLERLDQREQPLR